jgi:hypothetical protein
LLFEKSSVTQGTITIVPPPSPMGQFIRNLHTLNNSLAYLIGRITKENGEFSYKLTHTADEERP